MATKRKKMITFTSGIDIRSRSASKPTVAKFLTHLGPRYIVIGTPYGHVRTSGGDVRTWTTASGARKWIAANYPVTKSNPSRGTRWRMDDGSIVTTDQLKRKFFGKLPTPNQRRMLGICRVKTAKTKAAPRRRSR